MRTCKNNGGAVTPRATGLIGTVLLLALSVAAVGAGEAPGKMIESIRVETGVEDKVGVFFKLSGAFTPKCFTLVGEDRKLICDFNDAAMAPDIEQTIPVEGELLFRIRIGRHVEPVRKIRVVLDMDRAKSYDIEQLFVKGKNEYVLIIQALKGKTAQ